MQLLSFYKTVNLTDEYSDRDMPTIANSLRDNGELEIVAKVNFKSKDIGLILTETSSNSEWKYPIDYSNETSVINIRAMNNENNPEKGLAVRLSETTDWKFFSSETGARFSNKILLTAAGVEMNAGDQIAFSIKFVPNTEVASDKRLFCAISSHGVLVD